MEEKTLVRDQFCLRALGSFVRLLNSTSWFDIDCWLHLINIDAVRDDNLVLLMFHPLATLLNGLISETNFFDWSLNLSLHSCAFIMIIYSTVLGGGFKRCWLWNSYWTYFDSDVWIFRRIVRFYFRVTCLILIMFCLGELPLKAVDLLFLNLLGILIYTG